MARIRTIKPELAAHEGLFDLEKETGLPIRFAWCMLFTVADRDGRFVWRPRTLKAQILPHDDIDFSRVLDAWMTRDFVRKYRVKGEWYGWIPTFTKHQVINNRESPSSIPPIEQADLVSQSLDACSTREPRDDDASTTREVHAQVEGKEGREGKGKEGSEEGRVTHASNGSGNRAEHSRASGDAWRDVTECDTEAYEAWLAYRKSENDPVPELVRLSHAKWLGGIQPPERQRELVATCIRLQFKRLRDPDQGGRFPTTNGNGTGVPHHPPLKSAEELEAEAVARGEDIWARKT